MGSSKLKILCLWSLLLCLSYHTYLMFNMDIGILQYVNNLYGTNVSSRLEDYLSKNTTLLITPRHVCQDDELLVTVILSKPSNFEARRMIRDTWGRKSANVGVYFLLGNDEKTRNDVVLESVRYNDIIQEPFVDAYYNLTIKSASMIKFFRDFCPNAKYLLKSDDDIFVDMPKLVDILTGIKEGNDLVMGHVLSQVSPNRRAASRWFMSRRLYERDMYPDFLCGPAYVLSNGAVKKLYQVMWQTALIPFEDVYLTGICAAEIRLKPLHHSGFGCGAIKNDTKFNCTDVTIHLGRVDVDIRKVWFERFQARCESN